MRMYSLTKICKKVKNENASYGEIQKPSQFNDCKGSYNVIVAGVGLEPTTFGL